MWGKYVPVYVRVARAEKAMMKLKKKGKLIEPVEVDGRLIAKQFWGKKWCEHLETFSDYDNRLPRGRTYVRNGSVCHLCIQEGTVEAIVSGSSLYNVSVSIKPLAVEKWTMIKKQCSGQIGSILELLQGKISEHVMEVVADDERGLFPDMNEIDFECSCPDWADMCKHVAAVLYGIGHRLDTQPELLFRLRGLDISELADSQIILESETSDHKLDGDELSDIFGIDLDMAPEKTQNQPSVIGDFFTGENLRDVRVNLKLTVVDLAKVLGVTAASINLWEKNPNPLSLEPRSKEALTDFLEKIMSGESTSSQQYDH